MAETRQLARIGLVALLIAGCLAVLLPFMAAILFAVIICTCTWPYYRKLWQHLGQRNTWSALAMTLLLLIALMLPMAYIAANMADSTSLVLEQLRSTLEHPQPALPKWLRDLPLIGDQLNDLWQRITSSQQELTKLLGRFYEPMRKLGLHLVQLMGNGIMQLVMVLFVAFFIYRDGPLLAKGLKLVIHKIAGGLGLEMLEIAESTIKAVMLGVFGTAVAQAVVAYLGFAISGSPAPFLLAAATFFLSVTAIGPPLIWGGAALWLFNQGDQGWAIFLALYGLLVISSVDNLIRPILISRSSNLPMLLIVPGVLGGAVAFGFVGIFLGPTLLVLGLALMQHWVSQHHMNTGNTP
ncbi:membrane protein [Novimethylophilus kurashikiensis]|uniref:Membrane protein n=1 Tax=Novimethylophilus kurashikiensis TaxID=1825523 RepID=A0A2R5FB98_9PROT|nr:AI-2E family transporter [Novimethylophilus kurashikiensis]GBG13904.1 membrane protein [Novimethylophilus kurashikiensis]